MNNLFVITIIIIIIFLFLISQHFEGFRGMGQRQRRRHYWNRGRGRGNWIGSSGVRRIGHRMRNRVRYPNWQGYSNNSFIEPRYNLWDSPNLWAEPCLCKKGCTPEGCAFPGNQPGDCVWASDCNCCRFY